MANLSFLMHGIEPVPDLFVPENLEDRTENQEVDELNERVKKEDENLELLDRGQLAMLPYFDLYVLSDRIYEPGKESVLKKRLQHICISCFTQLPDKEKHSPVVRLSYAIRKANNHNSLNFPDILTEALETRDEEFEELAYALRRDLLGNLGPTKSEISRHAREPLSHKPNGSNVPGWEEGAGDVWLSKRRNMYNAIGEAYALRARYQLMVKLAEAKS